MIAMISRFGEELNLPLENSSVPRQKVSYFHKSLFQAFWSATRLVNRDCGAIIALRSFEERSQIGCDVDAFRVMLLEL